MRPTTCSQAVEDELRRRRFGEVVRLEVGAGMDPALRARLIDWLDVDEVQVYDVEGMLDLGDLWQIAGLEGHADIRQTPWTPLTHPAFVARPGDRRRPARRVRADAHPATCSCTTRISHSRRASSGSSSRPSTTPTCWRSR